MKTKWINALKTQQCLAHIRCLIKGRFIIIWIIMREAVWFGRVGCAATKSCKSRLQVVLGDLPVTATVNNPGLFRPLKGSLMPSDRMFCCHFILANAAIRWVSWGQAWLRSVTAMMRATLSLGIALCLGYPVCSHEIPKYSGLLIVVILRPLAPGQYFQPYTFPQLPSLSLQLACWGWGFSRFCLALSMITHFAPECW